MKKSLLSVVLCVALLITAMGTMLAMPASAASGYDVLKGSTSANIPGKEDPATATVTNNDDGSVTINFPENDGSEVVFNLNDLIEGGVSIADFPYLEISATSDMPFDLSLYDPVNSLWISVWGNWCGAFVEGSKPSDNNGKMPAGTYTNVKVEVSGCYNYNYPEKLPAAKLLTVAIVPGGTGSVTISKLQQTDGIVDVDLNSRGDVSDLTWDKTINLLDQVDYVDCPAPSADDPQSSVKVTKNDDGSVTFGNTNGMWPSAAYTFAEPIVVNKSAAIEVDFTVTAGSNTTIYIFMGPCTPDSFGEGAYVYIANPDDILTTDLGSGNYKGVIFLEDTINKTVGNLDAVDKCFDEDGNYVITGVKVFGTNNNGATEDAVTVRKLNLLALNDDDPMPSTTKKEDKTTAPLGQATTGANGNTTTVNNGGAAGGNSASTGDVSEAALFIVVAAAAAAVVTLSVVSKKAKSR